MTSVKTTDILASILPKGYSMMLKMGWLKDTPLGIRGRGILTPITETMETRRDGDYGGLGYEESFSLTSEETNVDIKVVKVGDKYGVASSEYGDIFIPGGALRHLTNIAGTTRKEFIGVHLCAEIKTSEGRYHWRVGKIIGILPPPSKCIRFVGYYPSVTENTFEPDCGMDLMDQLYL
jgi:hypothetical protein